MNPWSRAEPGSEAVERELFARRARAMEARGTASGAPSLASVRQAAKSGRRSRAVDESREADASRSAHGRAFVAMALAAACMMAAFTKLPSAQPRDAIVADVDASAARGGPSARALETRSSDTCTLDDEVLVSEERRSCLAPAPLFSAAPKLAIASVRSPTTCASDESRDTDAVCR